MTFPAFSPLLAISLSQFSHSHIYSHSANYSSSLSPLCLSIFVTLLVSVAFGSSYSVSVRADLLPEATVLDSFHSSLSSPG
ncbi:hypothetical protein QN277_002002 [Acacia crassicarpa]|uniref:Uncharacterized protein n=1 Tax=Acacia crassicarpa TaxID=499986 RepID=A0AAE1N9X9_9FABA|nr:hypothetical protein QN277_002002 [Acacia crassicarpa]